jgi:hypothetical protein
MGRAFEAEVGGGQEVAAGQERVRVLPAKQPSAFAEALGRKLAEGHGIGADVHWGNEGFCVDVALRPGAGGEVTAGVLCDAARFAQSEDPVEWDAFRTAVLEKQGWRLQRVWTPHFFRDPKGATRAVASTAVAPPPPPPSSRSPQRA